MTQVRPSIIAFLVVVALVLGGEARLFGQNCACTNCPQNIPDNFGIDFFINVAGAANNDLAAPSQGICGVSVHFQHNYVGDLLIQLVSPSGQTIDLVGPVGVSASGGTAFTDFDVSFGPCLDAASPDPGFADTWDNLQAWGVFGDYDGTYWPATGCLEDFNLGPVNGLWSLHVEDQQGFDVGQLLDWELIFCDAAGIDCNTCIANAGNLNQTDVVACAGSSSLLLNLPPSYPFANPAPPATDYGYTYIIGAVPTGVILQIASAADLRAYPPGTYEVFGLSYLLNQAALLPTPNGSLTVAQLSTQLLSPMPPFCGDVSGNSVAVTVTIGSATPDSLLTKTICADSCQLFFGKNFCKTIDTTLILTDAGGCNYKARIDLTVLPKAQAVLNEAICKGQCSAVPGFADKCAAGTFSIKSLSSKGCDSTTTLILVVNEPVADIALPAPLTCLEDTIWLDGKGSTQPPNASFFWSGPGLVVPTLGDSARATAAGAYRLIVEKVLLSKVCRDTAAATVVSLIEKLTPSAGADATVCGAFSVDLKGLPSTAGSAAKWRLVGGPGSATFSNDAAFSTTATVSSKGLFRFELFESFGACAGRDTVAVLFSEKPLASLPVLTCDGTATNFTVSFSITAGQVPFSINGQGLAGSTFVSQPIPSGSAFSFLIQSADGCKSDSLKGLKNCDCQTFAGTMATAPLPVCEGEKAQFSAPTDAVLDANDGLVFVLHSGSGPSLGQVFEVNSTGIFQKSPALQFGVFYFVSAVAGNLDGAGGVLASDPCRSVAAGQPILFLEKPTADAGADATVCSLNFSLDGASLASASAAGEWSILSQPTGGGLTFLDSKSPKTAVSTVQSGLFRLEWAVEENGCEARDTVVLTVSEKPTALAIDDVCEPSGLFYRTIFEIAGGSGPFSVNSAAVAGAAFQSNLIGSGVASFFIIENADGCRSDTIFRQKDCACPTAAGAMSPQLLQGCEDAILTATHLGGQVLAPFDATAFVLHSGSGAALGQVFGINQTGVFSFKPAQMMPEIQYFISFVVGPAAGGGLPDLTAACTKIAKGQPVVWHDSPPANAGIDAYVCGKNGQLIANNTTGGLWTVLKTANAGASALLGAPASPTTDVAVSDLGVYRFLWTVSWPNGCVTVDSVEKYFQEKPFVGQFLETCNAANDSFSVSFTILGGTAPFVATGTAGVLNDIYFQSITLPSGSNYSIFTTDTNGCKAEATGSHDCLCATDAGAMSLLPLDFCEKSLAQAQFLGGAAGDTTFFFLHDAPGGSLGNVLASSAQPVFGFDAATMIFGKTYFISSAAGQKSPASGQPILTGPCFEIAPGQPVVFWPEPTASLEILPSEICEGESATLKILMAGAAPFSLSWTENGLLFSQNGSGGLFEKVVTPSQSTSYALAAASDGSPAGCAATVGGPQLLTVQPRVDANVLAAREVCNNSIFGSTVDFSQAILAGDATGSWADLDGSGAVGAFPILDFDGAATGVFRFEYTTAAAVFPCENVSRQLLLTVKNCPCPSAATTAPPVFCEGSAANFPLQTLVAAGAAAGQWSLTDWPTGATVLPTVSGSNLQLAGVGPGVFELTFSLVQTPPGACASSSSQLLVIEKRREAGTALAKISFCEGADSTLFLNEFLMGEDSMGVWSLIFSTAGAAGFDPFLGVFAAKSADFGLFRFRYEATAGAACEADEAFFEVEIFENPTAVAGPDRTLGCEMPTAAVELFGPTTSTGAGLVFEWKNEKGETVSTAEKAATATAGQYFLRVKNAATGCAASDSATVFPLTGGISNVFFSIDQPDCNGNSVGSIRVDSVAGGTGPYLFSLGGGAFSSQDFWPNLAVGVYAIAAEDALGCFWQDSSVEILVPSSLNLDIGADLNLTLGDTARIFATISPANADIDTIIWSPLLQPEKAGTSEQVFIPQFTQILEATAIDAAGCRSTSRILIAVTESRRVFVPNAFAPDSDENSRLILFGGPEVVEVRLFQAFDRWGERLFLREKFSANGDPANGWDGNFRGERMPPGVYVWTAEVLFLDGKVELLKGDFLLVR